MSQFIPILLKSENLSVLIVGGGKVGYRKAKDLCGKVRQIRVLSPHFLPEFGELSNIELIKEPYHKKYLEGVDILYSAVDDVAVRDQIFSDYKEVPGILANFVDYPEYCDFYTPAIIERDPILLSISSKGLAPGASGKLKLFLEKRLNWDRWVSFFWKWHEKRRKL